MSLPPPAQACLVHEFLTSSHKTEHVIREPHVNAVILFSPVYLCVCVRERERERERFRIELCVHASSLRGDTISRPVCWT
jgi:hypothetical protein